MKKKDVIKITLKAYNTAIKTIKTKKFNFNRSLNYLKKKNLIKYKFYPLMTL